MTTLDKTYLDMTDAEKVAFLEDKILLHDVDGDLLDTLQAQQDDRRRKLIPSELRDLVETDDGNVIGRIQRLSLDMRSAVILPDPQYTDVDERHLHWRALSRLKPFVPSHADK